MSKRRTSKQRLRDIANTAYSEIVKMTPRQRRAALKAVDALGTTNCGWTSYAMRSAFSQFLLMASARRCKARKERTGGEHE